MSGILAQFSDTLSIEEVNITARDIWKYQAGSKTERIDSTVLDIVKDGSLESLISRYSPIYLKSNAGGLSTIRFRGTAPDHTSVLFGGINLNSLTLGHSNMSAIPLFIFDDVTIQYGSSSANNGSGSIGGSIYLSSSPRWESKVSKEIRIATGSFGENLFGGKLILGNGRFESKTSAYYYKLENDFKFENTMYRDFSNNIFVRTDTQQYARVRNLGVIQDLNYRFSKKSYITNKIWLQHEWHEIQPNMSSNLDDDLEPEELYEKHIRTWSQYNNEKGLFHYHLGLGFVHDYQIYDNLKEQHIGTDRLIADLGIERDFNKNGFKAGAKYRFIHPNVYSYTDSIILREQHLDLYLSYYQYLFKKLKLTVNLRQMLVTDYNAPFTPALGIEYLINQYRNSSFKLQGNVSRFFRVPTFNDRFWGSQGNPNLKPEDGIHYEFGFAHFFSYKQVDTQVRINVFYMDVKDWIEWRNLSGWSANNIYEVVSKGIEAQWKMDITSKFGKVYSGLNYSYNPVQAVKKYNATDNLYRQLSYVPMQLANAWINLQYKKLTLSFDGKYTGWRYSNNVGDILDAYTLLNISSAYSFHYKKQSLRILFQINNLLNKSYQNEAFYAMPGIKYKFSLIFN